ncbi:MAG: hypothetical protein JST59_01555 [Actinobacteria bacterium]|nr:hypothetical protein [Actinomycetota bacterium]
MEEALSYHNNARLRRTIKLAVAGFALFKAAYAGVMYFQSKREIAYRKEQLSKPVYELKDDELINPPWNRSNLDSWLYRRGTARLM